ncbi:MAG TPA: ATP-dependent Clp protease proteolytic subunit [Euzebyales bacterium]|nr:ATP-dependent Clp protease proteolytic subunit [Euzebyales bacterium]
MIPGEPPPEIPPPGVPWHPRRQPDHPDPTTAPRVPVVPLVDPAPSGDPVEQLREDRRLLLMGTLDHAAADRVCAELMLADGRSADPVELTVNSPGGPVDALPAVLDVIGLLRAPLTTRCIGVATGTAAVVLASGTAGRAATPRATISLRLDGGHVIEGRVDDIRHGAAQVSELWRRIAEHLAAVSHLTQDEAAAELRDGSHLSVSEALAAGLIDNVAGR